MIQPQRYYEEAPRTSTVRMREATRRRTQRAKTRGLASIARIAGVLGFLVVTVLVYVALMARLTSLGDRVAHANAQRAALVEETSRLDDTIAALTSQERLAMLAQRLGMREARAYASVALPAPRPVEAPKGIAFLGSWFAK